MRSGCCAGHFLVMGKAEKSVIKNSLEMRNKPSAVIESGWAIGKSRPNPFNISAAAGHCLWRAGQVRTLLMAQIGRAACRERVCQSVELRGVAVTLKKKNI